MINIFKDIKLTGKAKTVSVALPAISLISLIICGFIVNLSITSFITSILFVLIFDALFFFYLECFAPKIFDIRGSVYFLTIAPAACLVLCFTGIFEIRMFVLFAVIVFIAGFADMGLGFINLLGYILLSFVLNGNIELTEAPFYVVIFIICILLHSIVSSKSLLYCELTVFFADILSLLIFAKFDFSVIISVCNILAIAFSLLMPALFYLLATRFNLKPPADVKADVPVVISADVTEAVTTPEPVSQKVQPAKNIKTSKKSNYKNKNTSKNKPSENLIPTEKAQASNVADITEVTTTQKDIAESADSNITAKEYADNVRIKELCEENEKVSRINEELNERLNELNTRPLSIEDAASLEGPYMTDIKNMSAKAYSHCLKIANLSAELASIIGCDDEYAFALGLYHEAPKLLGDDFESILKEKYHVPSHITRVITILRNKDNTMPFTREAGIVYLTDDILGTIHYVRVKNKADDISIEHIVNNTIKIRKEQNFLRLAGFSNEELQLLKLYYYELGGKYDTSD